MSVSNKRSLAHAPIDETDSEPSGNRRHHRARLRRLAAWRENFLLAGAAALKTGRPDADNTEAKVLLLQAKIGELMMENELLRDKAERLDAQLPLAPKRSRP